MSEKLLYVLTLILIIYINGYLSFDNSCEPQTTCHDCITNPARCVWCAHNDPFEIRCRLQSAVNSSSWCPEQPQNPESLIQITSDQHNRDFSSDPGNVIQIKPQKYNIRARVGETIKFNFTFKGAKNYPVDLYFLFDASITMQSVEKEAAQQSEDIYKMMKSMTNDVCLGMGKFIDKNAFPFNNKYSNLTYSFRHQLKLTTEFKNFHDTISNMTFGTNRDDPEGGLDALAQVIVCKDDIGWRNESRKIVIFLTDGPYHAAGDGKGAGLTRPYDGKCYTESGDYKNELTMDYPSVSMIKKLAAEHDVIILFLIEDKHLYIYQDLSKVIPGSKAHSFRNPSSRDAKQTTSMVDIINKIYQSITEYVKLKVNVKTGNRKNVLVSLNPDCTEKNTENDCETRTEQEKHFAGELKILEHDEFNKYVVEVLVEGISEKLTLDIDVITQCECEKHAKTTDYCNGEQQKCGVCECSNRRYGETCACVKSETSCKAKGSHDTCSDHGSCVCGACVCNEGFEGKYCQCKSNDCPLGPNNLLCSGHGSCVCGTCSCHHGWTKEQCQCTSSTDGCKGPDNKICNGKGVCECGQCKCPVPPKWYKRYDKLDGLCKVIPCPTCHSAQCLELDACALSLWDKGTCQDPRMRPRWVKTLSENYTSSDGWNLCPDIRIDTGCFARYVYKYNEQDYSIDIQVLEEKDCTKSYLIYGVTCLIVLLIIGCALVFGWKLHNDMRDKREYETFINQHKDDLDAFTNPTYIAPTSIFLNPVFGNPGVSH